MTDPDPVAAATTTGAVPSPAPARRTSRMGHARSRSRRWPVVLFLAAVLVGAGLVDRAVRAPGAPAPLTLASAAAPLGSESSSWYCTGGSGTAGGAASATLYLVNRGPRVVAGTVAVDSATGRSGTTAVAVPTGGEATVVPARVVQGAWLASTVTLSGGGVTVTELVDGPTGWAQAPCATVTSPTWYFASGSTTDGNTLFVSLYNPTSTTAVVDLSFVTPEGETTPQPFEGLVLAPGGVVVAGVASYVQDQPSVATVVQARSGRVVADELWVHDAGGLAGLSLRLGAPSPEQRWYLPRTVDVTGGSARTVVLNPTSSSQKVTVEVQLPSGPVAPYVRQVAPGAVWTLATSRATRIPVDTDFATTVAASGPGVVVDRVVQSAAAGAVPQWGAAGAMAGGSVSVGSGTWVLPTPVVPATPPEAGAVPFALALQNPSGHDVTVHLARLAAGGDLPLGRVPALRIPAHAFAVVEPATLQAAGTHPLVVEATGPLAAMEDASPAGMPGVVALAAVPQR